MFVSPKYKRLSNSISVSNLHILEILSPGSHLVFRFVQVCVPGIWSPELCEPEPPAPCSHNMNVSGVITTYPTCTLPCSTSVIGCGATVGRGTRGSTTKPLNGEDTPPTVDPVMVRRRGSKSLPTLGKIGTTNLKRIGCVSVSSPTLSCEDSTHEAVRDVRRALQ